MRTGVLLAVGTPRQIMEGAQAATLEQAFLTYAGSSAGAHG
jgi:hypothetical protein